MTRRRVADKPSVIARKAKQEAAEKAKQEEIERRAQAKAKPKPRKERKTTRKRVVFPETRRTIDDLSDDDLEDLLVSLEIIAAARLETISDAEVLRREAFEHYQKVLREIRWTHLRANRALIESIDECARRGIPREMAYEHVGLSSQRVGAMRRQVAAAETKLRKVERELAEKTNTKEPE